MEDYIDILIQHVRNQSLHFCLDYYIQQNREREAQESLLATLDGAQKKLYLAYEEAHNRADNLYEDTLLRQIFLLAREVYR